MDAIKVNGDNYPSLREESGGEKQSAKGGERRKKGGEIKNVGKRTKPGCDSRPVVSGSPSHHLRATNNSCYKHTVGAQELKYPGGTRPLLEEGGRGGAAGGGEPGGDSLSLLDALDALDPFRV